ncbi:hypothetical protein AB0424_28645 [Streptomyces sp. NPDC051180]|uniref:hypothetical protein n=1 Tax=unclassified Streptomyces TaxID=2593676 RepID=UPI00344C3124
MIPEGRTAVDDAGAARLLGISLGTFRNKKAWQQLEPALLSRPDARTRVYDEEVLRAIVAGQPLPARPWLDADAPLADGDLLDSIEAWEALPEEGRVTLATWRGYLSTGAGPSPDTNFGTPRTSPGTKTKAAPGAADHWYRATVLQWAAQREDAPASGGRPQGSKDSRPRDLSGDARHQQAEERRAHVRTALTTDPAPDLDTLAADLGVSRRHAERLVAEARESQM